MLKSPYLFAVSVLVALINWTIPAYAQDIRYELSFDLPPAKNALVEDKVQHQPYVEEGEIIKENESNAIAKLSYPIDELPPIVVSATVSEAVQSARPTNSHTTDSNTADIALTFSADAVSLEPIPKQPLSAQISSDQSSLKVSTPEEESTGLFEAVSTEEISASTVLDEPVAVEFESFDGWQLDDWIFENGSNSLVARTVGSAEGTRYANGRRTTAYFGHTDPGNGVWNLGTFSYQHEAASPEEADEKQLRRLKRQGLQLEAQAKEMGISLSLTEKLNGLDLANQAPLAALDKGGYIERLVQARRLNMQEEEAILWARTYAYIDPDTRRWNAPGLGNNVKSITLDQERRMAAIAEALRAYDHYSIEVSALDSLESITLESATDLAQQTIGQFNNPSTSVADLQSDSERYLSSDSSATNLEVSFDLPAIGNGSSSNALATAALNTIENGGEKEAVKSAPERTSAQTTDVLEAIAIDTDSLELASLEVVDLDLADVGVADIGVANTDSKTTEIAALDEVYLLTDLDTRMQIEMDQPDASENIGITFIPSQVSTTASAKQILQQVEAPSVDSTVEASEDLFSIHQSPDRSLPHNPTSSAELAANTESAVTTETNLQSLIEGVSDEKRITEEERDRLLKTELTTETSANSLPSQSQSEAASLPQGPSPSSSTSSEPSSGITLWRTEDKVLQAK